MRGLDEPFHLFWKPVAVWRDLGRRVLDGVMPPSTLDRPVARASSIGLSAAAWGRIIFLEDPVCDGCGAPFAHDMGEGALCEVCTVRRRPIARIRAACLYDEHSRDLILQLKHADRVDLAPLFAAWLSRAAAPLTAVSDVIVPAPLHRWRLLRRRYNQAAEIARPLAARTGLAYAPDALVRRRDTGSQAGRSGAGRRRNVAGAFETPAGRRALIEGRRVLLVDDVLTTGATLEACARALRKAGAREVCAAVIARVRDRASPG